MVLSGCFRSVERVSEVAYQLVYQWAMNHYSKESRVSQKHAALMENDLMRWCCINAKISL